MQAYPWPDPDAFDQSRLDALGAELPGKMKLIVFGPGGVLENVEMLVGFDRMCYIIADDPRLAADIFDAVGSRLVRYYERCAHHPAVGALISNDDWGFKTATMLSPADMRRYVFPWHKRIVETIHAAGKPAILHSCGNLAEVMDDIIDDMKYDAKHSFEDTIEPDREGLRALRRAHRDPRRHRRRLPLPLVRRRHPAPRPRHARPRREAGRLGPRHGQLRPGVHPGIQLPLHDRRRHRPRLRLSPRLLGKTEPSGVILDGDCGLWPTA